uniref:Uncharacterized protein n=1 Tax=Triticum urartu TaxID=4572 RepID=A0A8R7VBV2_TRIUA
MRLTYSILLEVHVRLTRSLNARLLLRIIKFCANIYIELYFDHFREGSQELKPSGELGLEKFHDPGLHPERLGEHRRWDGRVGAEKRERHKDDAGVLAVEGDDHGSIGLTDVELEVHEAARDEERLPSAHHPRVELVPRVKAAKDSNKELTFHHDADLGGTGMDVWRVGAPRREVHTVHRHAQRVGTGPLNHVKLRHGRAVWGGRVAGLGQLGREEEVVAGLRHGLAWVPVHRDRLAVQVSDTKVLERVRVGGQSRTKEQHGEQASYGFCVLHCLLGNK